MVLATEDFSVKQAQIHFKLATHKRCSNLGPYVPKVQFLLATLAYTHHTTNQQLYQQFDMWAFLTTLSSNC